MPHECHSSASAYSSAKSAGWLYSVSDERLCGRVAEQHVPQWPRQVGIGGGRAAIDRGAEHRHRVVQLTSHGRALCALAGEEERHRRRRLPVGRRRGRHQRGRAPEGFGRFPARADDEAAAYREVGAAGAGRVTQVGQRFVRLSIEEVGPAGRQCLERRRCPGAQRQQVPGPVGCGGRLGGRRFQRDVRDRAARSEGADAGDPARIAAGPRRRPHGYHGRDLVGIDVGVDRAEVQVRRHLAVLQREHGLDDSADAGRRFHVTERALQRADDERVRGGTSFMEDGAERFHLDRIAERRAGAVRLDVADRRRCDAGRPEGGADDRLLGRSVRHGEAAARAVLPHGRSADDGQHAVAVGPRLRQPLQHDDAAALAASVAVGGAIERLAPPVGGQHARLRHRDRVVGRQHQVHARRERHLALPGVQALARQVDGDERRRAGGVDGQARSAKTEEVGEAAGGDVRHVARGGVGIDLREVVAVDHLRIVERRQADVDACRRSGEALGRQAGVFERLPGDLEQQPLLRIHRDRLARGDAEEARIEPVDPVEESAPARVRPAGRAGRGIEVVVDAPAIGRHFADRIRAGAQQPPEVVGPVAAAREAAAHADDRDRLVPIPLELLDARLLLLKRRERRAEPARVIDRRLVSHVPPGCRALRAARPAGAPARPPTACPDRRPLRERPLRSAPAPPGRRRGPRGSRRAPARSDS